MPPLGQVCNSGLRGAYLRQHMLHTTSSWIDGRLVYCTPLRFNRSGAATSACRHLLFSKRRHMPVLESCRLVMNDGIILPSGQSCLLHMQPHQLCLTAVQVMTGAHYHELANLKVMLRHQTAVYAPASDLNHQMSRPSMLREQTLSLLGVVHGHDRVVLRLWHYQRLS